MDAQVLKNAQAMPAITWHRLRSNDADIELPAGLELSRSPMSVEAESDVFGTADAFDAALANMQKALDATRKAAAPDTRAMARAVCENVPADDLDVPALSAYERRAVESELAQNVAADFETGMGPQATAWLESAAEKRVVLATTNGQNASAFVRIEGVDGHVSVGALDVVCAPRSKLDLTVALDSPAACQGARGLVGLSLRVFAGAQAHVSIGVTQTLDDGWTALDNTGLVLDSGAHVQVRHVELGSGAAYTGLACDLRGDESSLDIDTRYVGAGAQTRDFNYVVRHRGKKTSCNLDAKGVLMGSSSKTLRGTIDLVRGCKGSQGTEQETVVLADEGVSNRTVPVILCDEDDVAGNHGATIGHVRPEQLFYLESRGLAPSAAEALFASATFEDAALNAADERIRAGIKRVADAHHVAFEEVA